jgi:hypothetical protein
MENKQAIRKNHWLGILLLTSMLMLFNACENDILGNGETSTQSGVGTEGGGSYYDMGAGSNGGRTGGDYYP